MAQAALTNWQNMMTERMLSEQLVFGFEHPLLSLMTGLDKGTDYIYTRDPNQQRFTKAMDVGKELFSGKKVTVPLQLGDVSSGSLAEGATFRVTAPVDTNQATYNLVDRDTPIGVTVDLDRDSRDGSTSAMRAIDAYIQSAYRAHARLDNDYLHGGALGTAPTNGLLANVTGAGGSPGLTIPVAGANMDQLTPGRVVTILTRSNGANPGNGLRRKILSVSRTSGAETITVDTNAYASDGQSGNVTFSANEGVYVDSPVTGVQPAPFGLGSVVATSGTVGGLDKASVTQWQGISVDAGAVILSDDAIDSVCYRLRGNGVGAPDFGIAHPLTVDPYKASKTSLVMINQQTVMVPAGFKGIVYQGADKEFPILKDLASPRLKARFPYLESLRIYSDGEGPSFLDDDNTTFRYVGRAAVKEAWLYDRWQLVARDCGKNGEITNLSE
jgi:hypothetical protein